MVIEMFGRAKAVGNIDFEAIESMAGLFLDGFDNYDIYIMEKGNKTYNYMRKTGGSPAVGGVYINGVVENVIGVYHVVRLKGSSYEDESEHLRIEPALFIIDGEPYYVNTIDIISSIPVVSSIPIYDRFAFFGEFERKVKTFSAGGDTLARGLTFFNVHGVDDVAVRIPFDFEYKDILGDKEEYLELERSNLVIVYDNASGWFERMDASASIFDERDYTYITGEFDIDFDNGVINFYNIETKEGRAILNASGELLYEE